MQGQGAHPQRLKRGQWPRDAERERATARNPASFGAGRGPGRCSARPRRIVLTRLFLLRLTGRQVNPKHDQSIFIDDFYLPCPELAEIRGIILQQPSSNPRRFDLRDSQVGQLSTVRIAYVEAVVDDEVIAWHDRI